MVHHAERLWTVVAGVAVMAFSGCEASTDATRSEASETTSAATGQQTTSAPPAQAPTPENHVVKNTFFRSSDGNITCLIDADYVRCSIGDKVWSPPPRPADCEGDYGYNVAMESGGPAEFVCAGDSFLGEGDALPRGESIVAGSLRCDSAESGITCRNVESRQGFSISREAYELF